MVKSEPINIDRVEHILLTSPTHYLPGEYTFPFQLDIPGDIVTTDSSVLQMSSVSWEHSLVSSATPVGLMSRRKEFRQKLEMRRVQVEPSSTAFSHFEASRDGQIDCSIHTSKFVALGQERLQVKLYMHAYSSQFKVKEVLVGALQKEWIEFDMDSHDPHKRGKRFVYVPYLIYVTNIFFLPFISFCFLSSGICTTPPYALFLPLKSFHFVLYPDP
jgi:hypothetical protein